MDIRTCIDAFNSDVMDTNVLFDYFSANYRQFLSHIDDVSSDRKKALALSIISRKAKVARYMSNDSNIMDILSLLSTSSDAKVRKNVYSTLHNLGISSDGYYELIDREDSFINIYHLLALLIKAHGVDENRMQSIVNRIDVTNTYYAKVTALINAQKARKVRYLANVNAQDKYLLTVPKASSKIVVSDAKKLGIDVIDVLDIGVIVGAVDVQKLLNIRSFDELLIMPNTAMDNYDSVDRLNDDIDRIVSREYIDNLLDAKGEEISYRIEIRGGSISPRERNDIALRLSKSIKDKSLVNIRDNYDIEIRIYIDDCVRVYLAVPILDNRFDYRHRALPASINPSTASIIAEYVLRYSRAKDTILDGFVGSGTMLAELYKRLSRGKYVGVDIDAHAIDVANGNIGDVIPDIRLIKGDICDYCGERADIMVSNLPFGTRVMSHDSIERLYDRLLDCMPRLVKDTGKAFLLTTNGKAMRNSVNHSDYSIIREIRVPSGGLVPYLFVIEKKLHTL